MSEPRCPFHAFHRDGMMRTDGNYGGAKGYEPNSYGEWQDDPTKKEPPLKLTGDIFNYDELGRIRRRLFHLARIAVQVDDTGATTGFIRKYGSGNGRCGTVH